MRALVTGVAGFLGSTLAEALRREGFDVLGVDAFTRNYEPAVKRANLERLLRDSGFRLVEADLRSADLTPLLEGVSHVAHLAALPGVRPSWGDSFRDYAEHNIIATQRLLEAARGRNLVRIAVASSSSIYGAPHRYPTPEDENPRPISPYGVTKLAAEALVHAYRHEHGLPAVALRYFTVYGPRQRPDMGFHRFFEAGRRGEPVTIYGDGAQTRDFTYVDDAVQATLASLTREGKEFAYNVGGGHRVALREVLDVIERLVGRKIERRHIEPQHGDPRDTSADTKLARRDLGYEPRTALEEGLRQQWEWQRNT
ncbi:MAG TPA: NAD-dependent epimerase/dehydratase family protein [Candidatus Limnocylindrales bacterium]|nr:NAD-dependent epimerase/dehydratase family protein [Candidatus Limnocylindrales bacterium]